MNILFWIKRKVKHLPKCGYAKYEFPQCCRCHNDGDFWMTYQSVNRAKRGKCPRFLKVGKEVAE